ncbi:MAG TPA: DNA polymerase ligase N-terminal domain-containing protein [Gemmatimonadaceae bacterium]|nr:DNA polymerase ligase N-terminal domain-containing protein [Gemmatimonadaceae bacterium]
MATTRKRTVKRPVAKTRSAKTGATATKGSTSRSSAKKTARSGSSAKKTARSGSSAKKAPTRKRAPSRTAKPLAEYNRKRDFSRTKEPAGTVPKARGKTLHFVVQKHAASHLHYDFRLELDGVMKSWAVPKGPSYDPGVRRLAMEVEDHPISYNTFEGTIPAGEYGGGTVMLWDRGTYEAEDGGGVESLRRGYAKGDLKILLHGTRLRGGWVLVRMNRPGRPQWLLIKHRDATADPDFDVTADETTSVVTDRSMEEIAQGNRVWRSNR